MNIRTNRYSLILIFLFLFIQLVSVTVTGEELIELADQVDYYIDPGHGGTTGLNPCGVVTCVEASEYANDSCANGYYSEKHINLEVALMVKDLIDIFNHFLMSYQEKLIHH